MGFVFFFTACYSSLERTDRIAFIETISFCPLSRVFAISSWNVKQQVKMRNSLFNSWNEVTACRIIIKQAKAGVRRSFGRAPACVGVSPALFDQWEDMAMPNFTYVEERSLLRSSSEFSLRELAVWVWSTHWIYLNFVYLISMWGSGICWRWPLLLITFEIKQNTLTIT